MEHKGNWKKVKPKKLVKHGKLYKWKNETWKKETTGTMEK